MKKLIAVMVMVVMLLTLSGCGNKDYFDTVRKFDYAIVSFPDETTQKIELKSWTDYEDGEQLQITTKDGTVYLVNSVNCVLVREK